MQIVSIETTTNFGSIAFVEDGLIKKEVFFESSDIAGEIVEKLNIVYDDFDYVVVSNGPGSWTGIKIGISFAKGLTFSDKKIYCVNIFETFFYSVKDFKDNFLCIVNCTKDKFYICEFKGRFNYNGKFKIKIIDLNQLIWFIKKKKHFLIGPGVLNLKEIIDIEKIKTIGFLWYPRASLNGILAYEKIKRNIPSPLPEPIYGK